MSYLFSSLIFDLLGLGAYSSSTDEDDSDNENGGTNSDWESESILKVIFAILTTSTSTNESIRKFRNESTKSK